MNQKKKRFSRRLYLFFVFVVLLSISTSMLWSYQLLKNNSLFFMPSYEDSLHGLPSNQQQNELLPVLDDDMKVAQKLEVLKTDKIMSSEWYSPIVLQKHKLVFFDVPKVASTTWKKFFRRVEGQADWQSGENKLPHKPQTNSLVYLNQLNTSYVAEIMQDPSWTKAIFVRDPKKRFLSAFLNKAQRNEGKWIGRCCRQFRIPGEKDMRKMPSFLKCIEDGRKDLSGFLKMTETCHNEHWDPIANRIDSKYWKYINYMGKMENLAEDGTRLLKRLGNDVWETYGQSGWGMYGNSSVFETRSQVSNANLELSQWYTRETERMVEERFAKDYNMFQYEKISIVISNCTLLSEEEAPIPVILMADGRTADGRTGSSITWSTVARMTGLSTKAYEVTGQNLNKTMAFFDSIDPKVGSHFAVERLCQLQHQARKNVARGEGIVGFQWKPIGYGLNHKYGIGALKEIASHSDPSIRVIHLTRNPLDRLISNRKHTATSTIQAHCAIGDEECIQEHKQAARQIALPLAKELRSTLKNGLGHDRTVGDILGSHGIKHIHVDYDRLYHSKEANEWLRIFKFLGRGPQENLTIEEVQSNFDLAPTTTSHHKDLIANFDEVWNALNGTDLAYLVH